MAEPPPPPFQTTLSDQAAAELEGDHDLAAAANAAVLRAANELRRQLEMGENLARDVFGRRENVVVRVSLIPPDVVRIEGVSRGGPVPDGAIEV